MDKPIRPQNWRRREILVETKTFVLAHKFGSLHPSGTGSLLVSSEAKARHRQIREPRAHSPACLRTAARVLADKRNPKRSRCSSKWSIRGIRPSTFARSRIPIVPVKVNFNGSACNRPSPFIQDQRGGWKLRSQRQHFLFPNTQIRRREHLV